MDKATLQIIWESLNGVLYDITEGEPADAQEAVEECIRLIEQTGMVG